MEALVTSLHTGVSSDPVVRAAMAHLNLVMIHPFRDGNGRMARALATLVSTRSDIGEPEFSSIEQTATRDLAAPAAAGILTAYGNGRGRYYAACEPLKQIQESRRMRHIRSVCCPSPVP
jgi:fido (protein-threonine AMPylation protein)